MTRAFGGNSDFIVNQLAELQKWYSAQCNDDWEHGYGVQIDTLDNPGWTVTIDLAGTGLELKPFIEVHALDPDTTWIRCWVTEAKFRGVGGPYMLE